MKKDKLKKAVNTAFIEFYKLYKTLNNMHKKIVEKVLCKIFSKDTFIHDNNSSYAIKQDGYFFNIKIDFIKTTMLIDVVKDNKTQMYETPYFTFTGKP